MRNNGHSNGGSKKSNLQVLPTPKGNSPVQVPIHEDLKHVQKLTLQNVAQKEEEMEEKVSPGVQKKFASAAKSDNMSVSS